MKIQLWSIYYEPVPTGIGPIVTVWARAMRDRGHEVEVVTSHPHYPEPIWGTSRRPYREERDGVPVLRLPLAIGRGTAAARLRQEASFAGEPGASHPCARHARRDRRVVAVVPRARACDGQRAFAPPPLGDVAPGHPSGRRGLATGLLGPGRALDAAWRLERSAYRSAERVVVISDAFADNLRGKA